ncbi:MAG TPA: hypothetical protein ENI88_07505 [Desulfobulbus sp.]|nr:hypothetical protein [Desulfobulbus sp.]
MKHLVNQVFTPGGMPRFTYVDRSGRDLEQSLGESKKHLCKMVTLTGSTKSGKTVLTNRIFPRLEADNVWVDGGSVGSENDFWSQILNELNEATESEVTTTQESAQNVEGKFGGKAGIPLLMEGKGEVGTSIGRKQSDSKKTKRSLSPRAAAISALRTHEIPLIIDDFHYLDRQFQGDLVRALKPLIFEGIPVIAIAIPHRRYDAIKVEREMTGRLLSIEVPPWSIDELTEIADRGFPLLQINVSGHIKQRLAQESYGSPHLMQEFCRALCRINRIEESMPHEVKISSLNEDIFHEVADGTGKIIYDRLAKGPRQRQLFPDGTVWPSESIKFGRQDVAGAKNLPLTAVQPENRQLLIKFTIF